MLQTGDYMYVTKSMGFVDSQTIIVGRSKYLITRIGHTNEWAIRNITSKCFVGTIAERFPRCYQAIKVGKVATINLPTSVENIPPFRWAVESLD